MSEAIHRTRRFLAWPIIVLANLSPCLAGVANAADAFNGQTIYRTYCETCHGRTGQGEMPGTPNFTRGQGLLQPDLSIANRIESGRSAMPAYQGILEADEILDVIAYIRTFF